jgi:hypothetical protein
VTNDVSPQILLAFLNDAWNRAANGANTLREQLVSDQSETLQLVRKGSLASAGKNSASQSYKNYGPGSITQVQAVEIISNILALYDQVKSKIKAEFLSSADFDYSEPSDFDYDVPCFDILTSNFTQLAAGSSVTLPDVRELRIPQIEEDSN